MADLAGVERWQDLGLPLWIAAGVAAGMWAAVLGLFAAWTEPRKVDPGPETLDLGGPEPPAVANLIAGDWRLGRDSLPATLLDLAARKHLAVDQVGDRTLIRITSKGDSGLTDYERMLLAHVRKLAGDNPDGVVPAEALTTGPDETAKGWWRDFRKAVHSDARARGLSRARWTPAVHSVLIGTALTVAAAVGLATSTIPDPETDTETGQDTDSDTDTATEDDDSNPLALAIVGGVITWGGLLSVVEAVGRRERDTPAGREAAASWLGFRALLAHDEIFAEQPPAGVAIWDRHLAYGAALGLAHGATRALPLGAESDTTAWSPVGGRWRVVRIRYPRFRPGYGRHPARAAIVGVILGAAGLLVLTKVPLDIDELLDPLRDDASVGEYVDEPYVELVGQIVLIAVAAAAGAVTAAGAWMLLAGSADLVTGRRQVEGRVLRYRVRGSEKDRRWYVAVDDGSGDEIHAWRFHTVQRAAQGATVQANVTRHLRHVRDFSISSGLSASRD